MSDTAAGVLWSCSTIWWRKYSGYLEIPKTVFEAVSTYKCQSEWAGDHTVVKTAVAYKCQKRFLRRLGTYKCQSEVAGDQKLKKITFQSQSEIDEKSVTG
jgi:hypothetical protein